MNGMARALDYDSMHGWLEEHMAEAHDMAADYEGDADARRFYAGRASAFFDLLSHIESELMYSRR